MLRVLPLAIVLLLGHHSIAQEELVAYVPKGHIDRAADTEDITLTSTDRHGLYAISLPAGTLHVDMLDSRGQRLTTQPLLVDGILDVRSLRASTYTLRAHTRNGIRIRRFALMGRGASLWAIDAEPVK